MGMEDTYEALRAGISFKKLIKWPIQESSAFVNMRVPNDQDRMQARFEAKKLFDVAKIPIDIGTGEEFETEVQRQMLYRILSCQDEDKPIAPTITAFREIITTEIFNFLDGELSKLQEKLSPVEDELTDEEFDRIYEMVKKNKASISSITNTRILQRLLTFTVGQESNSQLDSG